MMISAASPIFTVFSARVFIKEPVFIIDVVNVMLVFVGIILIVKPSFIFGAASMYNDDPYAIYAVIVLTLASIFLQSNVYVVLRMLKGAFFLNSLSVLCNFFSQNVIGLLHAHQWESLGF